jgi:hypothetical protein
MFLDRSPCPEPLRTDLTRLLEQHGVPGGEVVSVDRVEHARVSSNESCVFEVGLRDGRALRLFGKTSGPGSAAGHGGAGHGHWGGVAYEAEIYRQVLRESPVPTPKFFGAIRDEAAGRVHLLIEYLDGGWFVSSYREPLRAMGWASAWLGRFHAANGPRAADGSWPFLKRYDEDYYLGWARRTSLYAGPLHRRFPWLAPLAERFGGVVGTLLGAPPTVIHGEFYPHNVFYHGEAIYPLDWESAAVAPGEIDLAALTEGWEDEQIALFRRAYREARWPGGEPGQADQWFSAAQLFLQFRWLGDRPDWSRQQKVFYRYEVLKGLGVRLGLI